MNKSLKVSIIVLAISLMAFVVPILLLKHVMGSLFSLQNVFSELLRVNHTLEMISEGNLLAISMVCGCIGFLVGIGLFISALSKNK